MTEFVFVFLIALYSASPLIGFYFARRGVVHRG